MEPRLDYIELPAPVFDETKGFYATAFGLGWHDYGPGYAACESDRLDLALNALAKPSDPHGAGEENAAGPLVLFRVPDLDAQRSKVVGAGGSILSEPYDYPGGRRFHFVDPSGNVLGVYEPVAAG